MIAPASSVAARINMKFSKALSKIYGALNVAKSQDTKSTCKNQLHFEVSAANNWKANFITYMKYFKSQNSYG